MGGSNVRGCGWVCNPAPPMVVSSSWAILGCDFFHLTGFPGILYGVPAIQRVAPSTLRIVLQPQKDAIADPPRMTPRFQRS